MLVFIIECVVAVFLINGCIALTKGDTYRETVCTEKQQALAAELTKECFKHTDKKPGWEKRCQAVSTETFCTFVIRDRKK